MISYADERSFKENKWKQEYITRQAAINAAHHSKNSDYYEYIIDENNNESNYEEYDEILATHDIKMQAQIRKLKLETVYYFKIQERNSREYLAQSKIIIFKTPNANGKGAKIVNYKKTSVKSDSKTLGIDDAKGKSEVNSMKYHLDMNYVWIIVSSIIGILILILLLVTILLCRRSTNINSSNKKICTEEETQQSQQLLKRQLQQSQQQHNYETTTNSTSVSPSNLNIDLNSTSNPSQKLLINTTAAWLNNSTRNGIITSISGGGTSSSAGCNASLVGIGNCASSFIGSNHSGGYGPSALLMNNNLSTLNEQQQYQNTYSISSTGSSIKQLKMQLQAPQRLLSNEINFNYDMSVEKQQLGDCDGDDDIYNENNFDFRTLNDNSERLLSTSLLATDGKLIPNDVNAYLRRQMMLQNTPRKQLHNNLASLTNVNSYSQQHPQNKLHYSARPYMIDNSGIFCIF